MDTILDINSLDLRNNGNNINILVDTNVLLCMFYGNVAYVQEHSSGYIKDYQSVLKYFSANNSYIKLFATAININEALHVIEKTECKIYNDTFVNANLSLKDFRENPANRKRLQDMFKVFWKQVSRVMNIVDINFTKSFVHNYILLYDEQRYDCLDYSIVDYCKSNNKNFILTNDYDFYGYNHGITVLTANPRMLKRAI